MFFLEVVLVVEELDLASGRSKAHGSEEDEGLHGGRVNVDGTALRKSAKRAAREDAPARHVTSLRSLKTDVDGISYEFAIIGESSSAQ